MDSAGMQAIKDAQMGHSRKPKKGMKVEQLYEIYEQLNEAEEKGKLEVQYRNLLEAVSSAETEKGLLSQFITRFSEHFPHLAMETANVLFDLCEDELLTVRKQAEKDLVMVCKKLPNLVSTVADVFGQMLQTDNSGELNTVHNSLMSLFYINPEAAITGVFAQIRTGEALARDRCFKFLESKYKSLGPEVMSSVFEKRLFKEVTQVLQVVDTGEQFMTAMDILSSTNMAKTKEGRESIVAMIESMLLIKKSSREMEGDDIAKLLFAADYVFQFFPEINSAPIFSHFCNRVLPKIRFLVDRNESGYFSVLKMTVELSLYISTMEENEIELCINALLTELESFLYDPLEELERSSNKIPSYNFSFIESIMYTINTLLRLQPPLLSKIVTSRSGIQSKIAYLLRASVPYKSKLLDELQTLTVDERRNELTKIIALRALANISIFGKALYNAKAPSVEKIKLSWKISIPSLSVTSSPLVIPVHTRRVTLVKRNKAIKGRSSRTHHHGPENQPKKIYQPPNGKYSGRTMSYEDDSSSSVSYKDRARRYHRSNSARSASSMERYVVRKRARY